MTNVALAVKPFIRSVEYDEGPKKLTVRFQTSSYTYEGVPPEKGLAMSRMTAAAELEDAFYRGIEGKYKSERVSV